ncbi:hypothetical protein IAD21_03915 [Abditibacteriota bacterium]|nr:hypothetical protein IAD21_03915 [Abditibacteriota bacterium]
MKRNLMFAVAPLCAGLFVSVPLPALGATISGSGLSVTVNETNGSYSVSAAKSNWKFAGTLGAKLSNLATQTKSDRLGSYQEISFDWKDEDNWHGAIRTYQNRPLIAFDVASPKGGLGPTPDFPSFTALPRDLRKLSFSDGAFSPPAFRLNQTSTPWLLFDDAGQTAILSPASDFLVSQMHGDGGGLLASGLNAQVSPLPAGFTHRSFLVVGDGINSTFRSWGDAITDTSGKARPADDADLSVKYLGYWTDNGAFYYYNYDLDKGYTKTLLDLQQHYKERKIPLHYMQLDSWWYQKSLRASNGAIQTTKNTKLPVGTWNAYGGTLDYTASPFLFPQGMKAFNTDLGMPFMVHGRWLDPTGPYRRNYKLSGVVSVDPRWWNERMSYLKNNGVFSYEQDWLSDIYGNTPAMASDLSVGPAFADNMARSAQENGLTLQYCMATPRFFLQGAKYPNLTTIRTSGDRFERGKWNNFLYTSMFADVLRVRPWTDVFNSTESGNLTIAALSSGPVGVGDEIGKESTEALMSTCRADGVLVKPGAPLMPTDASILADARGDKRPLVASTYTDNGQRVGYLFAYPRTDDKPSFSMKPADLGLTGTVYAYDITTKTAKKVEAETTSEENFGQQGWMAYALAPVGRSGIAFLGDISKIVGTGKQRIASVNDEAGKLTVQVVLAANEPSVTLHGYSATAPQATSPNGIVAPVQYDAATGHFTISLSPATNARPTLSNGDSVNMVTMVLTTTR